MKMSSAIIVHRDQDQGITGAAGSGVSGGPGSSRHDSDELNCFRVRADLALRSPRRQGMPVADSDRRNWTRVRG